MRAAIVIFLGFVLQASLSNALKQVWNLDEWRRPPAIKPVAERTHLSDTIGQLEVCAGFELNPIGNCK